jgi:hypothetical protein
MDAQPMLSSPTARKPLLEELGVKLVCLEQTQLMQINPNQSYYYQTMLVGSEFGLMGLKTMELAFHDCCWVLIVFQLWFIRQIEVFN